MWETLLSIVNSNADHFAIWSSCQSPWTPLMRRRPPSPRWRLWHSEPALLGWQLTKKDSFQFVGDRRHWGCRIIAIIPPADLHTVFTRWQIPNVAGVATAPTVAQLGLVYGQGHADSCAEWRPGQRHHQSRLSHRPPKRMRERSNYPKWSIKLTKTKWIYLTRLLSQPPTLPIATRLVVSRRKPYTDMAVWGPFQHRLQKKIKMKGVRFTSKGESSLSSTGPLTSNRGGSATWCSELVQSCSSRSRHRSWTMRRRSDTSVRDMESLAGPPSTRQMYEPVSNMLQDFEGWVKKRMTEHSKRDSITISILPSPGSGFGVSCAWKPLDSGIVKSQPCMLYLAKTTNLNALVEDDALTRPREIVTTSTRSMPAQTPQPSQPSRPTKRARGPDIREHRVGEDGSFTHTRQGIELCRLFQTGECTEKDSRHNCARNSKCLAETHGANKCQSDGPKQPRAKNGRKGRGKGSKWLGPLQSVHENSEVQMKTDPLG